MWRGPGGGVKRDGGRAKEGGSGGADLGALEAGHPRAQPGAQVSSLFSLHFLLGLGATRAHGPRQGHVGTGVGPRRKRQALRQAGRRSATVADRTNHKAAREHASCDIVVSLQLLPRRVTHAAPRRGCGCLPRLPVLIQLQEAETFFADAVEPVGARALPSLGGLQIGDLPVRLAFDALGELRFGPELSIARPGHGGATATLAITLAIAVVATTLAAVIAPGAIVARVGIRRLSLAIIPRRACRGPALACLGRQLSCIVAVHDVRGDVLRPVFAEQSIGCRGCSYAHGSRTTEIS